jgi:hypothetical protein
MVLSSGHDSTKTLKIAFNGFRNPRTTEASDSFTIKTFDEDDFQIDTGTGFAITMTTAGSLDSFSASPGNLTNGAMTNYTLTFKSSIPLTNGDVMYITFPSDVSLLASGVSCKAVSKISAISCANSGQNLVVKLTTLQ